METRKYFPYGGVLSGSGEIPTDNLFTGRKLDSYINLYLMGVRWHDPFSTPNDVRQEIVGYWTCGPLSELPRLLGGQNQMKTGRPAGMAGARVPSSG